MAQHILDLLRSLLAHYGYGAVAGALLLENAGLPVPGETVLLLASFLAYSEHHLRLPYIILIGICAATVGDNLGPSWHILGWVTVPGTDRTPPVLLSVGPADNAINIAPTSDLVLNFSENVRAGSGNIVIHQSSDGSTIASIAIGDTTEIGFSGSSVVVETLAEPG